MDFVAIAILNIILNVVWGFATDAVITKKGYADNWFWWGFFFGFAAFLVALLHPRNEYCDVYNTHSGDGTTPLSSAVESMEKEEAEARIQKLLNDGGWKCCCGNVNPSYTGTCVCGRSKEWNTEYEVKQKAEENTKIQMMEDSVKFDNIKRLKELLDMGAITQDEYNEKKKQYL